jgi:hypothetical protein
MLCLTADYSFLMTPLCAIGQRLCLIAMSLLYTEFEWVIQWQMALRPAIAIAGFCICWMVFQVLTKGHVVYLKRIQSPDHVEGVTSDLAHVSSCNVTYDQSCEGLGTKGSHAWSCAPLVIMYPFSGSCVDLGWVKIQLVFFVASL